jgi:transposase
VPRTSFGGGWIVVWGGISMEARTELVVDTVEIHRIIWPARNPDLNPIEHVWDMVGRRVKARTPAPANLRDLRAAVIQEW